MNKDEALKMALNAMANKMESDNNGNPLTKYDAALQEAMDAGVEALATNKDSSLVQPAQEPISFEMDELTEEWYGVLDDKTAIMIYGGNRGYWSNKIYTHSTPDSTPDSTPAHQWQGLTDNEKLASIRKWAENNTMRGQELIGLCDAIEQALKEKNHG